MLYVLALALGSLLLGSSLTAQDTTSCRLRVDERAGIDSARQSRANALLKGDPVAATDVAPEDGVILPAGGPVQQGRPALLEFFKARTQPGVFKRVEIRPTEVLGCGAYAYDWGHFRWETASGIRDSTKYLWVWRHEPDGRWRLAVAMWNQDR
jgi:ketosteroid isomerase-like protein